MQKFLLNKKNLYWFSFIILFLTPLPNITSDIYSPSLPHIVHDYMASEYLVKMSVTIYLAAYGLSQLILGFASDYFGRRNLLLGGILLFLFSSTAIVVKYDIYILLLLRMMQGIGAGSVSVITKAMISDSYSGDRLNNMANYKVNLQIASLVVAPFLGGIVQKFLGWQWNFIILSIYACAAFIMSYYYVPETCVSRKFNILSLKNDSIDTLCNHRFIWATLATTFIYSIAMIFPVCGTFFMQNVLHYNSVIYGVMALVLGGSYLAGSILRKFFVFNANLGLLFTSVTMLLGTSIINNIYIAIFEFALIMFFTGYLLSTVMAYALSTFKLYPGIANALYGTLVMLGTSIIIAIISLIHISSYASLNITYVMLCLIECFLIHKMLKVEI